MDFYPGAHGLCRLFAASHAPLTPRHVAGIYAALSPLNNWDSNVDNVLGVLRDWSAASVNTTDANFHKALRIRCGEDPEQVLSGRKVTAFFRAMANPDNWTLPGAIDRHLINLALGLQSPTKREQADLAHDDSLYLKVEAAYQDLGKREGIGNRLASIAWFVQRRIARSGQQVILHPDAPVCCSTLMWGQGVKRFYCKVCKKTRARTVKTPSILPPELEFDIHVPFPVSVVGQVPVVYLPRSHPHRNSGGWQYLSRHVVMEVTKRILRKDEHVHHSNGKKLDCKTGNLEVWLAERHGRHHANHQLLYMLRDQIGRFAKSTVPSYAKQVADNLQDVPF